MEVEPLQLKLHLLLLQIYSLIQQFDGHWGGGHPYCGGTDHTIISWGGPIAILRWDNNTLTYHHTTVITLPNEL
jgi:hypothetical protein